MVSNHHPVQGVLGELRYKRTSSGFEKASSSRDSYDLLSRSSPHYVRFCPELDREMIIIPPHQIVRHYSPPDGLRRLLASDSDPLIGRIVRRLSERSGLEGDCFGVTGSFLIGAQTASSDIDLVVYGLANYPKVVEALKKCIAEGTFSPLESKDWHQIYCKRVPPASPYSYAEFLWHESRKWNRAKLLGMRFDILSARGAGEIRGDFADTVCRRLGRAVARCRVVDAGLGYDYPARYLVQDCVALHREVREIVSYTHTYVDQVRDGEKAICGGILEEVSGKVAHNRILVGSTRESPGEFLKVLKSGRERSWPTIG